MATVATLSTLGINLIFVYTSAYLYLKKENESTILRRYQQRVYTYRQRETDKLALERWWYR
ncbi:hypothetical protein GCM10028895_21390 [Pontibacter rugosus]